MPYKTLVFPETEEGVALAASAALAGKLVAFPTETVFGLGAIVTNQHAVERIFEAKQRPANHPLIAHVANAEGLKSWVQTPLPRLASLLIDQFWPGPLTLVLPKSDRMPSAVTGGQSTVGIRCPAHPIAQAFLAKVGVPVAAPSANRFGRVSPTCVSHVLDELDGRIDAVLSGEPSNIGIESTIVAVLQEEVVLLRPGSITSDDIEKVIGQAVKRREQSDAISTIRVSGALEQHYSPMAKVVLVSAEELPNLLAAPGDSSIRVLGWSQAFLSASNQMAAKLKRPSLSLVSLPDNPAQVAIDLYSQLRQADHDKVNLLYIEKPLTTVAWEGVADRLKRASA